MARRRETYPGRPLATDLASGFDNDVQRYPPVLLTNTLPCSARTTPGFDASGKACHRQG